MAYMTILQYTADTLAGEKNMGVFCQDQHAGSEERKMDWGEGGGEGGKGVRDRETERQRERESTPDQEPDRGPGRLGNGSGKEERTVAKTKLAPLSRLFLPPQL
jgi:hypothetical protein